MMVVAKQSSRHKMWSKITRRKYEREGQRYASDLTDAEWTLIEPQTFPRSSQCRAISTIGETTACLRRSILRCCCKHAKRRAGNRAHRRGVLTANRSRPPRAVGRVVTMRPRRSKGV